MRPFASARIALFALALGAGCGGSEPSQQPGLADSGRRLNILVYMIDTLRADRLGCYGYERPVSPAIDAFAADATLFADAVAQSPWTRPSVASLMTGVWPRTHGVNDRKDTLVPEALTLPEILREGGYRTVGFVTNRNVAHLFGFGQGFDLYKMLPESHDTAADVHRRAAGWLSAWRREGGEEPFFLYLHTAEPHTPYAPPEPFRRRFAPEVPDDGTGSRWWMKRLKAGEIPVNDELVGHLSALYDAEIAANDASFGDLLALLEELELSEETVVVLVSDHGEEFFEHGHWEHGKSLHTELLDVPLIVRFPGSSWVPSRGRRVEEPVQHIDLPPTLLALLGLPVPAGMEGRDLGPLALGGEASGPAEIFSYLDLDRFQAASVTTAGWRLIEGRSPPHGLGVELYDRRHDRGERDDRAARHPAAVEELRSRLALRELATEAALAPGEAVLDEETERQLRALGYLD